MVFGFLKKKDQPENLRGLHKPRENKRLTDEEQQKALDEYRESIGQDIYVETTLSNFDLLNVDKVDKRLNEPEDIDADEMPFRIRSPHYEFYAPRQFTFDSDEEVARKEAAGEGVEYYRAVQALGAGAFGAVYKAERVNKDGELIEGSEPIVVKYTTDKGDRAYKKRLLREIAMQAVMHPAQVIEPKLSTDIREDYLGTRSIIEMDEIAAFHGAKRYNGMKEGETVYVIGLEQVDGKDMVKLNQENEGPIPVDTMTEIMLPIARGIEKMHQRGLIHRDIKPQNIMASLENPENAKLIDMGIGKDLYQEMTEVGEMKIARLQRNADWFSRQTEGRIKDLQNGEKPDDDLESILKSVKKLRTELDEAITKKQVDEAANIVKRMEIKYRSLFPEDDGLSLENNLENNNDVLPSSRVTKVGGIVGTPSYMSAEAVSGIDDPKNDWYSLAVTAMNLTGEIIIPEIKESTPTRADSKGEENKRKLTAEEEEERQKNLEEEKLKLKLKKIRERDFIQPIDVESEKFKKEHPRESERIAIRAWNEFLKPPLPNEMIGVRTKVQQEAELTREDRDAIEHVLHDVSAGRPYTEVEERLKDVLIRNKLKPELNDEFYNTVQDFFQEQKAYFDQHQSVRVEQNPGAYILSQLETAKIVKAREEAQEAAKLAQVG